MVMVNTQGYSLKSGRREVAGQGRLVHQRHTPTYTCRVCWCCNSDEGVSDRVHPPAKYMPYKYILSLTHTTFTYHYSSSLF